MSKIQDIFNMFYQAFAREHKLSDQQQKVARAIMNCHTGAMGANISVCGECGHVEVHYNSCRNRHCPSCQGITKEVWADKRGEEAINAPYFHVVFTVPEQLRMLICQNKVQLFNLMYKATAKTVLALTKDRKFLGATPGFFSVLHTWGQNLDFHPHIHMVITGGGLDETGKWSQSSKKFFIPVKVLAKLFRGKFLADMKALYYGGKLCFYGDQSYLKDCNAFESLCRELYNIDWYCYTKKTFSGPQAVVKYLSLYTHRIAISNSRIVGFGDDTVTFNVRDKDNPGGKKALTLKGTEFIRRFLMHVLPKGFVKVRYYGVLAVRNRKTKLVSCQKQTGTPKYTLKYGGMRPVDIVKVLYQRDVYQCPCCETGRLSPIGGAGGSP